MYIHYTSDISCQVTHCVEAFRDLVRRGRGAPSDRPTHWLRQLQGASDNGCGSVDVVAGLLTLSGGLPEEGFNAQRMFGTLIQCTPNGSATWIYNHSGLPSMIVMLLI